MSYSLSTFAGTATVAGYEEGNPGKMSVPQGLTIDSDGSIYVSDKGNTIISKITPQGYISTFAGTANVPGYDNNIPGKFEFIYELTIDSDGNIYVADGGNNIIRKITPQGYISTFAGTATVAGYDNNIPGKFNTPVGLTIDSDGNIYVADTENHVIRKITPQGYISTFAGTANVPGYDNNIPGKFNRPFGLTIDSDNNIYVADGGNHLIRKITPQGYVSTFAGTATVAGYLDGIPGEFNTPVGLTIDSDDNIYVGDANNHLIRKITPQGYVSTFAGTANVPGYDNNIPGKFNYPQGLTIDSDGNIYVADTENHVIRKITMSLYVYQPEETTLVDVNEPFTIEPDEQPYTLYFDGKSEPLPELQFNQCSFTIFENNVHIEGGGLSSKDLTLTPYFKDSRMYYGSIIYTLEPDIPATVQLVDASTEEPIGDPVQATGSYYINNLRDGRYYLRIVNGSLSYDHSIIADICFIKGTLVKTDQGYIEIDKITNQTLHRKPITVTKTIHHDPYLVKVSANAFGQFPTRDTYMSLKHKIILEAPIMAKNLINDDTIIEVPYDGEPLYNVLVDTHTTMKVNGMLVETLDPNSIVGLFYRAKLSPKQKQKMIQMINEDPIKAKSILTVL
jgi:sugar lactone lactonase YvrE